MIANLFNVDSFPCLKENVLLHIGHHYHSSFSSFEADWFFYYIHACCRGACFSGIGMLPVLAILRFIGKGLMIHCLYYFWPLIVLFMFFTCFVRK